VAYAHLYWEKTQQSLLFITAAMNKDIAILMKLIETVLKQHHTVWIRDVAHRRVCVWGGGGAEVTWYFPKEKKLGGGGNILTGKLRILRIIYTSSLAKLFVHYTLLCQFLERTYLH
jgi:hypothetical protein